MVAVHPGDGQEYRYTEWAAFNTAAASHAVDWTDLAGVELYLHEDGRLLETENLATDPYYANVVAAMSKRLRVGPLVGGGWGKPTWTS